MDGTVVIPIGKYEEMLETYTLMKALERYVNNAEEYSIDRERVSAICGFELKGSKKDAPM